MSTLPAVPPLATARLRFGERIDVHMAVAFVLAFITLWLRAYERFEAPALWAEDGVDFLPDALNGNWATLFRPTWGYFQVGQRAIAQLAVSIGVRHFVTVNFIAWTVLYAFAGAMLARPAYRALAPSDGARVMVGIALCFVPGLHEIVGNLCNLHWVLSLGLWLIGIKPASERLRGWELGWVAVAAFSGGEAIIAIPIFAYRAFEGVRGSRRHIWKNGDTVALGLLIVAAVLNVTQRAHHPPGLGPGLAQMASGVRYMVLNYFVYLPWLGPQNTAWLGRHSNQNFFALWGALALLTAVAVMARRRASTDLQVLIGTLAWLFVVVLTWWARPGAVTWWDRQFFEIGELTHRYAFDLAPVALVFWLVVLRPGTLDASRLSHQLQLGLTLALLGAGIYLHGTELGRIGPYPTQVGDWRESAALLEEAIRSGTPQKVVFPISPTGWRFQYTVGGVQK